MAKLPEKDELVSYFKEMIDCLKIIQDNISKRNKTMRMRALYNIAQLTMARVKASHDYARSGGYEDFMLVAQKELYNPIAEFLMEEATK